MIVGALRVKQGLLPPSLRTAVLPRIPFVGYCLVFFVPPCSALEGLNWLLLILWSVNLMVWHKRIDRAQRFRCKDLVTVEHIKPRLLIVDEKLR